VLVPRALVGRQSLAVFGSLPSHTNFGMWCAYGDPCSTVVGHTWDTFEMRTACGAAVRRQTVPKKDWTTRTHLHASGALLDWRSSGDGSPDEIHLRSPEGAARVATVAGGVYYVTFWDASRVLVHRNTVDDNNVTHFSLLLWDTRAGPPRELFSLDAVRGPAYRKAFPPGPVVELPQFGKGQPVVVNVGGLPALLAGDGTVWAWKQR
jgi:hypothetical protein